MAGKVGWVVCTVPYLVPGYGAAVEPAVWTSGLCGGGGGCLKLQSVRPLIAVLGTRFAVWFLARGSANRMKITTVTNTARMKRAREEPGTMFLLGCRQVEGAPSCNCPCLIPRFPSNTEPTPQYRVGTYSAVHASHWFRTSDQATMTKVMHGPHPPPTLARRPLCASARSNHADAATTQQPRSN